jgi:REP element-mobilizing transposase RayT
MPIFELQLILNMSSFHQTTYQIIFATKSRERTITETHCNELYKYIWGIVKNHNCHLYQINGVEDHLHIVSDLHPTISLADYVKNIKVASSLWIKQTGGFPLFKGWQDGYGAFTYSKEERDTIINYVKNQKEHHKKESFTEEYKRILDEQGIRFDEKYLL